MQAELDQLKQDHQALVQEKEALAAAVNEKARSEKVMKSEFTQLKKLAKEAPHARGSDPLPAAYVEQLRKAAAVASLLDPQGVAESDARAAAANHD